MLLKKLYFTCFFFFIFSTAYCQSITIDSPKIIDKDSNSILLTVKEKEYNVGDGKVFIYRKPKAFGFLTNLPKDAAGIASVTFQKKSVKPLLWVAGSTVILLFADQSITNGVQRFSRNIDLHPEEDYKDVLDMPFSKKGASLLKAPQNLNTALYQVGQGFPGLIIGAGLFVYGKIHKDYRAISTANQLAESFILMGISTQLLKRITGRQSPSEATSSGGTWHFFPSFKQFQNHTPNYDAFPSGHIATLMSTITILSENYPEKKWIKPIGYSIGPKKDQNELTIEMNKHYGTKFIHIPSVKVYLSQTNVGARETTSRSRSLLFIGLALLTAEPKDVNIIVPENGTVSLNYPLSPSRRSSCSTRTTHPTFLMYVEQIFGELGIKTKIENPYKFRTKGEMVKSCSNKVLLEKILTQSNSCGKRGHRAHWDDSGTHCGICMPCIYRRSALINGDKTPYGNQINALTKNSIFTKKWQDVGSMLDFLHEKADTNKLKFELISNGLQGQPNLYNYIDLIRRTKKELSNWVKSKGNTFVKTKAGL